MTTIAKEREASSMRRSDLFDRIILIPSVLNLADEVLDSNITLKRPLVNITETATDYAIEIAAPGLELDDFKLRLEDNVLVVSAEGKEGEMNEDINYRRQEYSFFTFRRAFQFPEGVLLDEIVGEYLNGIFCVFVPKNHGIIELSEDEVGSYKV